MMISKVLILEDNPSIRQMYQTKLEGEGFEVQVAGSGEEGLELVKKFHPDVVLLDVMMTGMTGVDFVGNFRRYKDNDRAKIIVLTNLDDPKLRKSFGNLISAYVIKAETNPSDIVSKVKALV